ncbi:MAG: preprotein translocase subunit SecG [Gammaproteobacteria bacterium CG22_combo_CG10-13_8_21_14_all_40_8]|nr:MAG: preprotein translocase subunit SecG [Gammaproteobacteria bacterium CG22_combo_CG10-13_8_21_14_all_40_8]
MYEILLMAFMIVAVALVGLILVQHGKGADMGASFGAGASATVFGSAGAGNFLTRSTAVLATAFFLIALSLAYLTTQKNKGVQDTASKIEKTMTVEAPNPAETGIPAADTEINSDKVDVKATDTKAPAEAVKAETEKAETVKAEAEKAVAEPAVKQERQDIPPTDK